MTLYDLLLDDLRFGTDFVFCMSLSISSSPNLFRNKKIPANTMTVETTFIGVMTSERITPEKIIPKTDVVEYSKIVLTDPIVLSPIKKKIVDIPVSIIDMKIIVGSCIKSISIGI